MSYLRVDSRVVPSATIVSTVAICLCIRSQFAITKLSGDENGKPLIVHNVLVGSNSQLSSTIVKPFVLFINTRVFTSPDELFSIFLQLSGPVVMDSEPEDSHGQQERIFITTRISNS